MKLPAAKLIATIVCSLSMLGAAAAPSEACCFLSSLFGCCSPRYGACYAPSGCSPCRSSPCGPSGCSTYYSPGCSTGSCGSTAYYAPAWSASCSSCAPCGTGCSPCGPNCASGDCAVSSVDPSASSIAPPVADPNWRKKKPETYAPESGSGTNSGSSSGNEATGSGSSGSSGGTRTKPEGFRNEEDDSTSFKLPASKGEIEQTSGEESGESIPVRPRGKKSPEAPSIPPDDEAGNGAGHLPTLNLDEKIAWRSAPERKRVALKVRTANARLVRVPAYPKSDWTPVEPESKVAKK